MGRAAFKAWLDHPSGAERGVTMDGVFVSWDTLAQTARERAGELAPGHSYVADPSCGFDGIASFLAIASTPDTNVLWAKAADVPFPLSPVAAGLFACAESPKHSATRPFYSTLTSGTSGSPKIPVAYGDMLELIALHYYHAAYLPSFAGEPEVNVLATALPLQYAASFIMILIPALFLKKDLLIFSPHRWDQLCAAASREFVVCLMVPSLIPAARAATPELVHLPKAALIMASGYLTPERLRTARETYGDVTLMNCYGASETGIVSIDRDPGKGFHVGQPIFGKPVWLEDVNEDGVGRIATSGVDCREFYWLQDEALKRQDGSVAATDFGHFDESGNLYLDGRLDGGEKLHGITVYPRQIERHILDLQGVADVAVRIRVVNGIDHLAVRVVGRVTEDQLREHCSSLPEVDRPTLVECLPEGFEHYSSHGKL